MNRYHALAVLLFLIVAGIIFVPLPADHSRTVKILHADGLTVKYLFKLDADGRNVHKKVFDEKGVLRRDEAHVAAIGPREGDPGLLYRDIKNSTAYREDGKTVWLRYERNTAAYSDKPPVFLTEYWPDGKTVKTVVFSSKKVRNYDWNSKDPEFLRVHVCDHDGMPIRELTIRGDYSVKEENDLANGKVSHYAAGEKSFGELKTLIDSCLDHSDEAFLDTYIYRSSNLSDDK
ncbi:MAG: hypothetical protein K2W82_10665 [Candidatus Obscuribacterales bacterium]|nr:hypothetical protein [Candidatus Obscuribacterales bacterium]